MYLTGGEAVAEFLIRQGIDAALCVPSEGILPLLDAFIGRESAIRLIPARDERGAAHAAIGHFKAAGKPLPLLVGYGSQAAALCPALADALSEGAAMLAVTGAPHTYMDGKGATGEIWRESGAPFAALFERVSKAVFSVGRADQVASALRMAWRAALSGRPGPAVVCLPLDVQAEGGEVEERELSAETIAAPCRPDPKSIGAAAQALYESRNSAILAGCGPLSGKAARALAEIAERTASTVCATVEGKGSAPERSRSFAGTVGYLGSRAANRAVSKAGVLLAVGCRFSERDACSFRRGETFSIPPTRLIQVSARPEEIGKNYPADLALVGDVEETLSAMAAWLRRRKMKQNPGRSEALRRLKEEKARESAALEKRLARGGKKLNVSFALACLGKALPASAITAVGPGALKGPFLREFPIEPPGMALCTDAQGSALAMALGAKIGRPGRTAAALLGDADFLQSIPTLCAAVQMGAPLLVVVLNNRGLGHVRRLQISAFGEDRPALADALDREGRPWSPDLAGLAKSAGAWSARVESGMDFQSAAATALREKRPAVIEAVVSESIATPDGSGWRDMPVPTYIPYLRPVYAKKRGGQEL